MKKIILIDDDPAIQDSARLIFKAGDFNVVILPNGYLILTDEFTVPDIFIIDKQLPGVDGLDICQYLKNREATKKIPVIMISANPSIGKLAKLAGADDFIEKPYTINQLREIVARYTA